MTSLWFLLMQLSSLAQSPYFRDIAANRQIDQANIELLYQDDTGFIWLGTDHGLFKYDGFAYQRFGLNDSLTNPSVTAIYQDIRGTIWAGYEDGTIAFMEENHLSLFTPEEGTPKVAITGILQDQDSVLWIATYGEGIYYYRNGRLYSINTDDDLNDNEIYSMTMDGEGRIWAGTDAGIAICHLENDTKKVEQITSESGLPDNIVYQLQPDANGNMWIGMYDGGVCYYNSDGQLIVPKAANNWHYGVVSSIAILSNEEVWIGTETQGIVAIGPHDQLKIVSHETNTRIYDLLADDQGQIWVAAQDGVQTANQSLGFIHFDQDTGFGNVQALAIDSKDNLWFSTPSGLYLRASKPGEIPEISKYNLSQGPKELNIISIYEDDFGYIWLGTFEYGVLRFKPNSDYFQPLNETNGLINNNVLSISGSGHEVWLATLGGVSKCILGEATDNHRPDFKFENFSEEDGVGVNYIYKVFIDSKGREWFATDGKGVALLNEGKFITYGEEQGIDNRIISMVEDEAGNMWFSSPNNGIFKFDGHVFSHYSSDQGLNDLEISSIAKDINGNILIISETGLEVLDPETGLVLPYGIESGISDINPDINAVATDGYGRVWIGTQTGIIKFNGTAPISLRPHTELTNVNLYLNPVPVKNGHAFKYNEDHISFDYIGLWYRDPKEVSYQHKLEGFDIDWINSRDRTATYPKLPPGSYRFVVKSSANENFESGSTAQFDFIVKSPFWSKTWFYILSFLVGLGVLALFIKTRERSLKKAERVKSELMVAEFETLKSQVNPHFLFNSFNTLIGAIEENKELAIEYVQKLSDFFRNMLAYREQSLIKLQEELDLVMDYFFLQQKRFGSNLEIEINISSEKKDYLIPPLTLQMLVENALKHNIISKTRPLKIEIFDRDNYLVVKNNKQLKKNLEPSTGFGLQSIIRRYQLLSKRSVLIENEPKLYLVGIPLLKKA